MHFAVADTGVGISEADQARLFEAYVQVGEPHPGTGLGLALTKRLVELHGGSITARSTLGIGSEFSVSLPIHDTAPIDFEKPTLLHRKKDDLGADFSAAD